LGGDSFPQNPAVYIFREFPLMEGGKEGQQEEGDIVFVKRGRDSK